MVGAGGGHRASLAKKGSLVGQGRPSDAEPPGDHRAQLTQHDPQSFSSYVAQLLGQQRSLGQDLQGRLAYYKKCKDSNNPRVQMQLQNDPHYLYFA